MPRGSRPYGQRKLAFAAGELMVDRHITGLASVAPQTRTKASRTKKTPETPQAPTVLGAVFDEWDLAITVFERLTPMQLRMCSMVCTRFVRAIDSSVSNAFAAQLPWWGSCRTSWLGRGLMKFDHEKLQFHYTHAEQDVGEQLMWLLNTSLKVGRVVHMRMHIRLPLQGLMQMSGDAKQIAKIEGLGEVSVDVLQWKILKIETQEHQDLALRSVSNTPLSLVKVRMSVLEFTHNNPKVALKIPFPLVVAFANVPAPASPRSYRELWVVRGCTMCMHCHQRPKALQSYDCKETRARVLCKLCWEHLFVLESSLVRKWKINRRLPESVPRTHFIECFAGGVARVWPKHPLQCVEKQCVAEAFGHDSWADLLQNNCRFARKRPGTSVQAPKFYFNNRWF